MNDSTSTSKPEGPRCFFGRTGFAKEPCGDSPVTQWVVYSKREGGREVVLDREPVCDAHAEQALKAARSRWAGVYRAAELLPINGSVYLATYGLGDDRPNSMVDHVVEQPPRYAGGYQTLEGYVTELPHR